MRACDALFLGPHPDDVEIAAAGTILRLRAAGKTVSIVDASRGERGSRGTAADRQREAAAAAQALGIQERHNLGMPDTRIVADEASVLQVVGVLRETRAQLFVAPVERDVHPDHAAVAAIAARAWFLAGLVNVAPELGPPHRPRRFVRYPLNVPLEPTFVVDIGDLVAPKAAVIRCYASQLAPPDRRHLVQGLDLLERAEARDRFWGTRIGAVAAEPFVVDGPLPLRDVTPLLA